MAEALSKPIAAAVRGMVAVNNQLMVQNQQLFENLMKVCGVLVDRKSRQLLDAGALPRIDLPNGDRPKPSPT